MLWIRSQDYSPKPLALFYTGYPIWKVALVIHVFGWILQFIGHGVFEGRAPALLDSLDQVCSGLNGTTPGACTIKLFTAVIYEFS